MEAIPKPSKSLIKKYDKLIEENSTNSDGYFKRGRVRMELMDYLGANQDFTPSSSKG